MIRAGNQPGISAVLQQRVRSVAADIVERPQFVILSANNKDALISDFPGVIVSRVGNIAEVTLVLPGTIENAFVFEGIDLGIVVPFGGKRPRLLRGGGKEASTNKVTHRTVQQSLQGLVSHPFCLLPVFPGLRIGQIEQP